MAAERQEQAGVEVPWNRLEPETLRRVVEEYITREGTDYGDDEVPLETKVRQVMRQLEQETAVIVFDPATESCTIASRE